MRLLRQAATSVFKMEIGDTGIADCACHVLFAHNIERASKTGGTEDVGTRFQDGQGRGRQATNGAR